MRTRPLDQVMGKQKPEAEHVVESAIGPYAERVDEFFGPET